MKRKAIEDSKKKNKMDHSFDGDALSDQSPNEYGAMEKRVSCPPAGLAFNPLCAQMSGLSDVNCRLLSFLFHLSSSLVSLQTDREDNKSLLKRRADL